MGHTHTKHDWTRTRSAALIATLGAGVAGALAACDAPGKIDWPTHAQTNSTYPKAHRGEHTDSYHGVEVADPYRWLEDSKDQDTQRWITEQAALFDSYIQNVQARDAVERRLMGLMNYERYGIPSQRAGRYFYSYNSGLQNQSVILVADSLQDDPQVLLDPNTLSADGTIALSGTALSHDGKIIAYSVSDGGSDWNTWLFRDVQTGKDYEDRIEWSKFSGAAWAPDNSGVFYTAYDQPEEELQSINVAPRLMFHRLGTNQEEDRVVFHNPDEPLWGYGAGVTDDGSYLTVHVWRGTERVNNVLVRDLRDDDSELQELRAGFEAMYDMVGNNGPDFYFVTDKDAPMGRLVCVDQRTGVEKEIVPETKDKMNGASMVGGKLVVTWLRDAKSVVTVHGLDGRFEREVQLPGVGAVEGFGGTLHDQETFYSFSSFANPGAIYRYDVNTGESELYKAPSVGFDADGFVTKQVFYTSTDGTRVPMFLTHKEGLELDGNNPTLLYGYGGFNVPITPGFRAKRIPWLEMGGVYAVANLRGGGEYGKEWHRAGTKILKQNVFDDFIAAGEWLIKEGYTASERLVTEGASNGGLLTAATMLQRPDLFGAVVSHVGVHDMLRFNKFTIGWAWESDYGDPDDVPSEFQALRAYSPYHNTVKDQAYPATLIVTGERDDRVAPAHSFKLAAALQHAQGGKEPVLIRIQRRAGHGAGKPLAMRVREAADVMGFVMNRFAMQAPAWWDQRN